MLKRSLKNFGSPFKNTDHKGKRKKKRKTNERLFAFHVNARKRQLQSFLRYTQAQLWKGNLWQIFVLEHDKKKPRAQWTIGVFYLEIIKLEVLLCDIWKMEQYLEYLDRSINYIQLNAKNAKMKWYQNLSMKETFQQIFRITSEILILLLFKNLIVYSLDVSLGRILYSAHFLKCGLNQGSSI